MELEVQKEVPLQLRSLLLYLPICISQVFQL